MPQQRNMTSTCESADALRRAATAVGIEPETVYEARVALEHELARVSNRVQRLETMLAQPMEPGEEPLVAMDVVLVSREPGDSDLQDRLQAVVSAKLPDAFSHRIVVSFLYAA